MVQVFLFPTFLRTMLYQLKVSLDTIEGQKQQMGVTPYVSKCLILDQNPALHATHLTAFGDRPVSCPIFPQVVFSEEHQSSNYSSVCSHVQAHPFPTTDPSPSPSFNLCLAFLRLEGGLQSQYIFIINAFSPPCGETCFLPFDTYVWEKLCIFISLPKAVSHFLDMTTWGKSEVT